MSYPAHQLSEEIESRITAAYAAEGYVLETDDGVPIVVVNRGLRRASAEVVERLTRGEIVPASEYYFRTCAQFETPLESRYAWLNAALFIGQAERLPNAAVVRFYEVL